MDDESPLTGVTTELSDCSVSKTYPREMACLVEGHKKIDVKVVELSAQATMDPGLFTPPADAAEVDTCPR